MTRIYTRAANSFAVPSVTTFLGAINKPALVPWSAKVEREATVEAAKTLYGVLLDRKEWITPLAYEGTLVSFIGKQKEATKRLAEAGEIGSEIHELIDWETRRRMGIKVVGRPPKARAEAIEAYKKWLAWVEEMDFKPVYLEQPVWNVEAQYAGRIDFTGELTVLESRAYTLGDYKSGKSIYTEALLQVAAYREAIRAMGHKVPDRAVIVRLPKVVTDPEPEIRVLEKDELDEHYQIFLKVMALYHWMKKYDTWKKPIKAQVVELPE